MSIAAEAIPGSGVVTRDETKNVEEVKKVELFAPGITQWYTDGRVNAGLTALNLVAYRTERSEREDYQNGTLQTHHIFTDFPAIQQYIERVSPSATAAQELENVDLKGLSPDFVIAATERAQMITLCAEELAQERAKWLTGPGSKQEWVISPHNGERVQAPVGRRIAYNYYSAWEAIAYAEERYKGSNLSEDLKALIDANARYISLFMDQAADLVDSGRMPSIASIPNFIPDFLKGSRPPNPHDIGKIFLLMSFAFFLASCNPQAISAADSPVQKLGTIPTRTPTAHFAEDVSDSPVASPAPTSSPSPTATNTSIPTNTPSPTATNTSIPTNTPSPTPTASPTQTPPLVWLAPVAEQCDVPGVRGISGPEIIIPQETEISRYFPQEYRENGVTYRTSINVTNGQDRTAPINFRTNGEAAAEHAELPLVFDTDTCVYLNGAFIRIMETDNGENAYTPYFRLVVKNESGEYVDFFVAASDMLPFLDENTLIMALGPLAIAYTPTGSFQDRNGDTYFGVVRNPGNVSAHQWNVDDPLEFRVINEDGAPLLGTSEITDDAVFSWLTEGQLVLVTYRSVQGFLVYEVVNNGDKLEMRPLPMVPGWGEELARWQQELMQQPQDDVPSQLEEADTGS